MNEQWDKQRTAQCAIDRKMLTDVHLVLCGGVTFRLAVLLSAFQLFSVSGFSAQILIVPPPPAPVINLQTLNTACGISNSDPAYQPTILNLSGWPNL
jgi:hypothetical protein